MNFPGKLHLSPIKLKRSLKRSSSESEFERLKVIF
jgi:hypothetical protein